MNNMNNNERAAEMAQCVKMLAAKADDLSLIPGIYMMEPHDEKTRAAPLSCSLTSMYVQLPHTQTK